MSLLALLLLHLHGLLYFSEFAHIIMHLATAVKKALKRAKKAEEESQKLKDVKSAIRNPAFSPRARCKAFWYANS